MNAPEKIYLEKVYPDNGVLPNGLNYNQGPNDIEYTRTDVFVEKAVNWLINNTDITHTGIKNFRKAMKGE